MGIDVGNLNVLDNDVAASGNAKTFALAEYMNQLVASLTSSQRLHYPGAAFAQQSLVGRDFNGRDTSLLVRDSSLARNSINKMFI